ncbi:hypothetical protein VTP01DRAFT_8971 [Rhizomucor pusillus]|uniref:uncharacterized protein n=1 Tax=Rhizomucor pusillus TaxID=4840 RepID=UPI003744A9F9
MFEQTNLLGASNSNRLELFKTKNELAKNFYDDPDFCPIASSEEVNEHRQRIQQRTSPQTSPSTSPPPSSGKRIIPIIDPSNMTPVSIPSASSPSAASSAASRRIPAMPLLNPSQRPAHHFLSVR